MIWIIINTSLYSVIMTVNHSAVFLLETNWTSWHNILNIKNMHTNSHSSRLDSSQTNSSGQLARIYVRFRYMDRTLIWHEYIDGLAQDCSNSIANALELLQYVTKPSIWRPLWFADISAAITICGFYVGFMDCWSKLESSRNLHREHMLPNGAIGWNHAS